LQVNYIDFRQGSFLDTVAEEDEGARRREVTDSEGYQSFFAVKQESFISCLLWVWSWSNKNRNENHFDSEGWRVWRRSDKRDFDYEANLTLIVKQAWDRLSSALKVCKKKPFIIFCKLIIVLCLWLLLLSLNLHNFFISRDSWKEAKILMREDTNWNWKSNFE